MTRDSDIQSLLMRAGNKLSAIDQIAAYLQQRGLPLEQVLAAYKNYLAHTPTSANAAFNYAYYLSRDGQFEFAVKHYRLALKSGIGSPEEVHLNIANIYMDHLHDSEMAKQHLSEALTLNPAYASAWYNLGNLSEQDGNRAEAIRCFEQCLKFDPANHSALARLADASTFMDKFDPLLQRLVAVAPDSNNSDVHFALGRAYEQLAEFDLAWQHFTKANELDKKSFPPYNREGMENLFAGIIAQCNKQWLASHRGKSEEFVFICGMFRTGSTLLEQVLAAHPVFVAGGESQFFPRLVAKELRHFPGGFSGISSEKINLWKQQHLQRIRNLFGEGDRVTDKRPDNFLYLGLIKAILPSAKFIVTERDWRDVATSVYSTRLGPRQNYATDLANIRHYIGLQTALIEHWQSLLGSDLIRVHYEDLVTHPRSTISGVLTHLGEEWDERCLSFNKLKNTVQTASVWQVREPFHTRSISRWKNYETYFETAFGADLMSE